MPYLLVDDELWQLDVASLRWRYDDLTNCKVLQDWTPVADPQAQGSITIPAALNAMSSRGPERQLNQLCIESTDSDGTVRQTLAYVELGAVFHGRQA